MLGRAKKPDIAQEDVGPAKTQTLAELDAMARESPRADDQELSGKDEDVEHEVTHTDELTVDTDVKKITGSQKRLWMSVVVSVSVLSTAGLMFYLQIEGGQNTGIGGASGNVRAEVPQTEVAELLRGTFMFVAGAAESNYRQHNVVDDATEDISIGATIVDSGSSEGFQLSSNSQVRAVRSSNGIYVNRLGIENTFLSEQSSQIRHWILVPDGTKIFAVVGASLHSYDTTSGEGGEVSDNFLPTGSEVSRLSYARGGSIQQYAKSGINLASSTYSISSGETTTGGTTVTRLDRIGAFNDHSLSPDGSSLVFTANINGNQTIQLLSLNSFVLRTIYLAETGNIPSQFSWSSDSNDLVVYESGNAPRLAVLRVGTLQKEIILDLPGAFSNPKWSPDKTQMSYVKEGKLFAVDVENKQVSELLDAVSETDVTGWFQN